MFAKKISFCLSWEGEVMKFEAMPTIEDYLKQDYVSFLMPFRCAGHQFL